MKSGPANLPALASALLYEGYALYPYTRSNVKNRRPLPFGVVRPQNCMQTECVLAGGGAAELGAEVRFLQLQDAARWEVVERQVTSGSAAVSSLLREPLVYPFHFPPVLGRVTIEAQPAGDGFRVRLRTENMSPPETLDFMHSTLSTHALLTAHGGRFVSSFDPGEAWREAAAPCRNIGAWPVLLDAADTMMLCSPIILYDHPLLARESGGDLFDSTEIEEALLLHLAALTDAEQREIAAGDGKLRAVLERAARTTPEEMLALHGVCRPARPEQKECV